MADPVTIVNRLFKEPFLPRTLPSQLYNPISFYGGTVIFRTPPPDRRDQYIFDSRTTWEDLLRTMRRDYKHAIGIEEIILNKDDDFDDEFDDEFQQDDQNDYSDYDAEDQEWDD